MAWIHHPELRVDVEVPDDTVDIWCGDPGWRPGTLDNPEPWNPPVLDENGNPVPTDTVADEAPASTVEPPTATKRTKATVPVGDSTTIPDTED